MLSFSYQESRKNNFLNWGGVFFLLAITSLPFCGAGHDDTWIMLFAGETLGQGQWFLNHNGATQEVSTSVLGALMAALASYLAPAGHEYVVWKFVAWLPAMFAGILLFDVVRRHCGTAFGYYWIFVLCCIPQWHNWAWGGLESGIFWLLSLSFLVVLTKWAQRPEWHLGWQVATLAFALPLARADALWAPLILLAAALWVKPAPIRLRLAPGLCAIAATLAFHALRYWLSGQWLPSPAYAKAALSAEGVQQGLRYLYQFHSQTPLHAILAITLPLSAWGITRLLRSTFSSGTNRPGLFEWAALLILIIDTTTIMVGGDWMGHHRFAIRSLPIKILLLALSVDMTLRWLDGRSQTRHVRNLACAAFAAIALTGWKADGVVENPGLSKAASQMSEEVPWSSDLIGYMTASNIPLHRDTLALLPWLDKDLPLLVEQARMTGTLPLVVASYQAGFFAREIRRRFDKRDLIFVDLAGLTERRIGSLPGDRTALGLSDGIFRWATAVGGEGSALGKFLSTCHPDVVYVIWPTPDANRIMAAAGYSASYKKIVSIDGAPHGAFIFTSSAVTRTVKCAPLMQAHDSAQP